MAHSLSPANFAKAVDLYNSGKTFEEIGTALNLPWPAIRYRIISHVDKAKHSAARKALYANGVLSKAPYKVQDTSIRKHKYGLDVHFFDLIDTEEKAYFFGLMCADGNVYPPQNVARISLQARDVEILERFRYAIKTNRPLFFDPRNKPHHQDSYVLTFGSKYMMEALIRHGCVPQKTKYLVFPSIRADLIRHFVRGYFDGNGSFGTTTNGAQHTLSWFFSIASTNAFNEGLARVLEAECGVTYHLVDKNGTNGILSVYGRLQVGRVMDWLYEGATVWMERKRAKYLSKLAENPSEPLETCSISI
jgi:hypothetical protein